uniref:UBA-like domain-containing protein n=1 Tax=Neogobius melanostomus TaxID=47308 RepID=A0A8C6TL68_9GOBI
MDIDMEELKRQVMVNQFVLTAGCAADQAQQLLQAAHWQFEVSSFLFFMSNSASSSYRPSSFCDWCPNSWKNVGHGPQAVVKFEKIRAHTAVWR